MFYSDDCAIAVVGGAEWGSKTKVISFDGKFKCPKTIDKSNWLGGHTYNDTFSVTQTETDMTVTRTDTNWSWGMDLKFLCCTGKIPLKF